MSEKKMLDELRSLGYNYYDSNYIFKQKELLHNEVLIILKWLPEVYKAHLGTGDLLTRSLISAKDPFDPSIIIKLFQDNKLNSSIKWSLAHVLAIAPTYDISDWLKNQLLDKESSFERAGLLDGLISKANINDVSELMQIIKKLFDKYCYFERFLKLFQKYATEEDISFLEENLSNPNLEDFLRYSKSPDIAFGTNTTKDVTKRFEKEILKVIGKIKKKKKGIAPVLHTLQKETVHYPKNSE